MDALNMTNAQADNHLLDYEMSKHTPRQPKPPKAQWYRASTGNLTRQFSKARATVFETKEPGLFAWCVARERGSVVFSREWYATEGEAVNAAEAEVNRPKQRISPTTRRKS